ncbi:ribosomal protein S18-alanine N-acetyltransferase [Novispirillum sp. DQ9]|uniref:ribosomal protein S18-alanine N-acetyltransferase n=1 Tax=Novispirillum sp. DQ9 TaxID=3398612 RepID=UPI003C7AFCFD
MTARIAPITPAHAEVCAAVHAEAFARPWTEAAFADLLALPTTRGAVLLDDDDGGGEPAGLVLLQAVAGEAEVLTIGVRPAWRRAGLGRRLLDWALAALAAEGVTRLFLEVEAGNAAARALYAAAGFTDVAVRRGYYEGGADAVVMARDLGAG